MECDAFVPAFAEVFAVFSVQGFVKSVFDRVSENIARVFSRFSWKGMIFAAIVVGSSS